MPETLNVLFEQQEYHDQMFEDVTVDDEEIGFKEFEMCLFHNCTFQETRFRGCRFLHCTFRHCDLQLIQVNECSFNEVLFEDSKVIGVNWTDACWEKRGLLNVLHFSRCAINHSTFVGLPLKRMTLTDCVARDVDFSEANLTRANCMKTDFSQSRFWQTNLTEADFRGAQNYAISAQVNTIKKTKFSLPDAMSLLYSLDIVLEE